VGVTGLSGLWALEWAWQFFCRFVGVKVGVANFFFGQSIGIDENNNNISVKIFSLASKL